MKKIKILLSNDDGIEAPGINVLRETLKDDYEIYVVAPSSERSAASHALSINKKLKYEKRYHDGEFIGYAFEGTPVDCVKFAISRLFKDNPPDIVVSGINRGQNTGNNVIYSGTVAAAIEGATFGIPSIAVSHNSRSNEKSDYLFSAKVVKNIIPIVLKKGLPPKTILNINVPHLPDEHINDIEVTRQAECVFTDLFVDDEPGNSEDSHVKNVGYIVNPSEKDDNADDHAVFTRNNVSITPIHFDLTNYSFLPELKTWFNEKLF